MPVWLKPEAHASWCASLTLFWNEFQHWWKLNIANKKTKVASHWRLPESQVSYNFARTCPMSLFFISSTFTLSHRKTHSWNVRLIWNYAKGYVLLQQERFSIGVGGSESITNCNTLSMNPRLFNDNEPVSTEREQKMFAQSITTYLTTWGLLIWGKLIHWAKSRCSFSYR